MSDNRVDQISVPLALRSHDRRLGILENAVGRWVYVLPVAPATDPPNFQAADPLSPSFQNSWTNIPTLQPVSFRIHPATKVQIRGNIDGGSIPSIVFTLPAGYRPQQGPASVTFPSYDGLSIFTGRIDTNGDVNILGTIT